MCGIAGWVSYGQDLTAQRPTMERMIATVECRGPDAAGIWSGRHVLLGHRRLAVIDLAGGAQPMVAASVDGAVVITYAGEVYNFKALRAELSDLGYRLRTSSDTEVVLTAYLAWGDQVAAHLNGMFAFGVWDARAERLLLVRDRLGVKPLYYMPTSDGVLFGSEPKVILAHPSVEPRVDLDGLRQLLGFVTRPGETIWRGMREVRPGAVVTVDAAGASERVYWRLAAAPHDDDLPTTIATVRRLLEDIVGHQLVADVPTCLLLSGGLDSSALTALAARRLSASGQRVASFSVAFAGGDDAFRPDDLRATADAPYARAVASHVGTSHSEIVIEAAALADPALRRRVVCAKDTPAGIEEIDLPLYLLCKGIRARATVALSGESADESFGGYAHFQKAAAGNREMFPWFPARRTGRGARSPLRADLAARLQLADYILDTYAQAVADVPRLDGEPGLDGRMREVCHLHLTHLLPILLERKDRISMATGLEVRVPFCDHRLVEYVFNVPWSMKTFDGREKSLLRAAVQDLLPDVVVSRRKSPFPAVQDPSYTGALQTQLRELQAASAHPVFELYDRCAVSELVTMSTTDVGRAERGLMERVLNTAVWIDATRPVFMAS